MIAYYLFIRGLLKNWAYWVSPLVFLFLSFIPRALLLFYPNNNFIPFVNSIFIFVSYGLSFLLLIFSIVRIFNNKDNSRNEILFYRSFGLSFIEQFIMRYLLVAVWTFVIFFMSSSVPWVFSFRLLLFLQVFGLSLFFLSSLSALFSNRLLYFIPTLLYIVSLFYPVYILPNPAYIFNAAIKDSLIYTSLYMILYILLSYKMFSISWRKRCSL